MLNLTVCSWLSANMTYEDAASVYWTTGTSAHYEQTVFE